MGFARLSQRRPMMTYRSFRSTPDLNAKGRSSNLNITYAYMAANAGSPGFFARQDVVYHKILKDIQDSKVLCSVFIIPVPCKAMFGF